MFLLDPMLASGGSAIAAIQCLLDADVPEEAITFVNLVAAPEGVHTVFKRFPNISMCTGMIDELLDEEKCRTAFVIRAITKRVYNADICPGLGDFGDRYFGRRSRGASSPRLSVSWHRNMRLIYVARSGNGGSSGGIVLGVHILDLASTNPGLQHRGRI